MRHVCPFLPFRSSSCVPLAELKLHVPWRRLRLMLMLLLLLQATAGEPTSSDRCSSRWWRRRCWAASLLPTLAAWRAWVSLPLVGMATKTIYGEDLLLAGGVDYKAYMKMIGERPSAQKVAADRKAAMPGT